MVHGQVGQHLAVQIYIFGVQLAHESGIRHTIGTHTGVDTYNPQIAEASLFGLAVAIRVLQTFFQRVLCDGPDILSPSELALRQLQSLFSAGPSGHYIY